MYHYLNYQGLGFFVVGIIFNGRAAAGNAAVAGLHYRHDLRLSDGGGGGGGGGGDGGGCGGCGGGCGGCGGGDVTNTDACYS